jgi:hypothetical protein
VSARSEVAFTPDYDERGSVAVQVAAKRESHLVTGRTTAVGIQREDGRWFAGVSPTRVTWAWSLAGVARDGRRAQPAERRVMMNPGGHYTKVLTTSDGEITTGILGQPVRQFRVTHGLGSTFISVATYDKDDTFLFPGPEITFLDENTILLNFNLPDAPATHLGNTRYVSAAAEWVADDVRIIVRF